MSSSTPPVPPVVLGTGNNIIINPLQRGNQVLDCIRNVGKEFGDIIADYQVGRTTGVLFLSLKYHRLHPEYIHIRIEKLGHSYTLRILLILCDITEHRDPIRELTKVCLINNITVLVAFSFEEAAHYLSTLKQFEHKPPDMIKERIDKDYNAILRTALTSISKVNKTDVETLRTSFGSFANIAKATPEQLRNLPGFGQVKVKNVKNTFEKPVRNNATRTLPTVVAASAATSSEAAEASGHLAGSTAAEPSTKEKEKDVVVSRPPREPSPVWDIERDLDDEDLPSAETGPLPEYPPRPFDIDLDLT
ncbi:putative binding domain of DNA repair protein Ercc1 (rad10/Swi10) [Lyophyllum shimeji]|uniref:Binding domain of DNA repair protein Ercc1 (Rad10/Swi10) n=1 Tax=Lyophyllum shimeji TaxID=47721 RepID=A0A9P3PL72_LYOSH|nr:putative binding domain of DNA repair protein Ercc1 (rad10/Swi10) [Lyophyllum shimeji]